MSARANILIVALAVLALLAAPFYLAPFTITLLNYIGVYSFVALGLVLLTGVAGMVSFGQASFMGIAAYATAWTSAIMGYSPWLGLVLAIVVTCAVAAVVGLATLRLQGHFLSLSTIAWGLALYFTFGNIAGLGAYNGIPSIPAPSLGSRSLRAMRALRGGNALVESLGIDALYVRLATFVIAALLAALSGWLYAHMSRFVSPTPFDVTWSIIFLMMAMVGGSGYLLGAVVGAALITLLKNWIQDVLPLIAPSSSGQLEIVVFSALFIVFLQRARDGIVPYVAQWLPETQRDRPQAAEALRF